MKVRRREGGFKTRFSGRVGRLRSCKGALLVLFLAGSLTPVAAQSSYSSIPQKTKLKGVIMERFPEGFMLRDYRGIEVAVDLTTVTEIKEEKKNFLRPALEYSSRHLIPGLDVKVEGTRSSGRILAEKVKFTQDALEVARTINSQVEPIQADLAETHSRLETFGNRLGQSERQGQRLSGEVEELEAAVKRNLAEVKRVEGKAEVALSGVEATNQRVSSLDHYETVDVLTIQFPFNSAEVPEQAQPQLDTLATKIFQQKGYLVEIRGFSSSDGDGLHNLRLSQQRAEQVRRYLVERHRVSVRRFVTPFGYGTAQPVGDETTLEGRQANRRVEVRVLISPGFQASEGPPEVASGTNPFR